MGKRTHQEEFYELIEVPEDLGLHNALLREHEAVYNGLRPHQALGYLTPNEFLARCQADHRWGRQSVSDLLRPYKAWCRRPRVARLSSFGRVCTHHA
jgi:hypothetical protein